MFLKNKEKTSTEEFKKYSTEEISEVKNSIISSLAKNDINIEYDAIDNIVNKYLKKYNPLVDKCKQAQQDRFNNYYEQTILDIESKLENCFKSKNYYKCELHNPPNCKCVKLIRNYFIKQELNVI